MSADVTNYEVLSSFLQPSMADEWFDSIDIDNFWMTWRMRALVKLCSDVDIPMQSPLLGLEIGLGSGLLRAQIERATRWTVDGADLSIAALAKCPSSRGRTLLYNVHDVRSEFREKYDFLVLFDVLEHIEHPRDFLVSCVHHLKPGGWLLLNVPALQILFSDYDRAIGHFRRYDQSTLLAELNISLFDRIDVRYWGCSLVPLLLARRLTLSVGSFMRPATRGEIIDRSVRPPHPAFNTALKLLMRCETAMASHPPLGTSVLAACRRPQHT